MSLWQLILRQLRQRSLSSVLTALSVALGVMLVSAILLLQHQMERHFLEPGRGYSIVVGAPGSALQLVLNSVYHMDKSPGLLPMRTWLELEEDESVALAVPYAVGDSFHGYRVVATTDAFFDERFPHPEGEGGAKLAEGRPFEFSRDRLFGILERLGAAHLDEHEVEEAREPKDVAVRADGTYALDETPVALDAVAAAVGEASVHVLVDHEAPFDAVIALFETLRAADVHDLRIEHAEEHHEHHGDAHEEEDHDAKDVEVNAEGEYEVGEAHLALEAAVTAVRGHVVHVIAAEEAPVAALVALLRALHEADVEQIRVMGEHEHEHEHGEHEEDGHHDEHEHGEHDEDGHHDEHEHGDHDAHEHGDHDEHEHGDHDEDGDEHAHADGDDHAHEGDHDHDDHGGEHEEAGHDDHDDHGHDDHGHHHDHDAVMEAVLGAEVAASMRIQVGDEIEPTHGVEGGTAHDHEHLWKVVGILKPTGTPVDRVVFINLDSFFAIDEHAAGALIPGTQEAGLSTVLVFPRPGVHKAMLLSKLNRRPDLQVADVNEQIRNLFTIVGSVDVIFLLVSVLVVLIGVLSILVAIYNTMSERRREVAILRAIGARRRTVFGAIVGEATLLTILGALGGLVLGHVLVWAAAARVEEAAGFRPDAGMLLSVELLVLVVVTAAGALAGIVPAWKAYRTDVAESLRPLS
ncbi:MAG: ABC transporter permease [Sandaracinus sp.]|nr:ABC transporter permease [Sandaracinus sp.]MCB9621947.1 ABC transporter permease [Sandaracinus sp.]